MPITEVDSFGESARQAGYGYWQQYTQADPVASVLSSGVTGESHILPAPASL